MIIVSADEAVYDYQQGETMDVLSILECLLYGGYDIDIVVYLYYCVVYSVVYLLYSLLYPIYCVLEQAYFFICEDWRLVRDSKLIIIIF